MDDGNDDDDSNVGSNGGDILMFLSPICIHFFTHTHVHIARISPYR